MMHLIGSSTRDYNRDKTGKGDRLPRYPKTSLKERPSYESYTVTKPKTYVKDLKVWW